VIVSREGSFTVRNLSPGNTLNDAPFHEAPLRVGDRLRLGKIEFEVLPRPDNQSCGLDFSPLPSRTQPSRTERGSCDFGARMDRLEQKLANYAQRDAGRDARVGEASPAGFQQAIENLTQQVAEERQRRLADQQLWETERQRLNTELAKSAEQLSELATELTRQQQHREATAEQCRQIRLQLADLEETRARWTEERDAAILEHRRVLEDSQRVQQQLEVELAESREQLLRLKGDLDSQRRLQTEWETARAQLEADRKNLQEALEKHAAQIEQLHRDHEQEKHRWTEERAALESAMTAKESELVQYQHDSAGSREAFDRERQQLEEMLQQEREAREELEQQTQQHRSKCEALEWRVDEYEQIVAELRDKCEELRAATGKTLLDVADGSQLSMDQQDIQPPSEAEECLEEPQERAETRFPSADLALDEQDPRYAELPDDDATDSHETALPCQVAATDPTDTDPSVECEWPRTEDQRSEVSAETTPPESEREVDPQDRLDPLEGADAGTQTGPPVNTAEVLARLGHGEFASDEQPAAFDDRLSPIEVPADPMSENTTAAALPTPALGDELAHMIAKDDEEETIEAYMSRLLRRVGGASAEGAMLNLSSDARISKSTPAPANTPPASAADLGSVAADADEAFAPRRAAPELSSDFAAMRALANDTARTAIASHDDRSVSTRVKTRMLVCFLALMMNAALLLVFASQPVVLGVGMVSGLLLLAYVTQLAWSIRNRLFPSPDFQPPSPSAAKQAPEIDPTELDQADVTPGS
jgi:hypothetical protein